MAVLKPKEMAERLGVTVRTLQEWDRKGIFQHIVLQQISATILNRIILSTLIIILILRRISAR